MKFGEALELAKQGHRIARTGWNGKRMWVCYSPGSTITDASRVWGKATRDWAEQQLARGEEVIIRPYMIMKTAQEDLQIGWLASQSDMLADDWVDLDE
jgi:hypothetical protein